MRLIGFAFLCSFSGMMAQDISFYGKQIIADSIYFGIKSNIYAPLEIKLAPKKEFDSQVRGSETVLLNPRDSISVLGVIPLSIVPDTASVVLTKYFDFSGTWGNSKTTSHNDLYRYRLPYKKGNRVKIIQSFGGGFSHNTDRSRYAIDFGTQIGDTIYAAREGTVVKTKANSKERGGRDKIDAANVVMILHNDGTIGSYVHLDFEGVLVDPGQKVSKGQAIGISGFTGFTTTPHLHFVVREGGNMSVPIYFEGLPKKALKKGKRYKH